MLAVFLHFLLEIELNSQPTLQIQNPKATVQDFFTQVGHQTMSAYIDLIIGSPLILYMV